MDKRVLRERMRRKKRQMMIRHYTKIGLSVLGLILAIVFVVRGIIIPIAHHVAGGGSSIRLCRPRQIRKRFRLILMRL